MVKEFRLSAMITSAIMLVIGFVFLLKPALSIKIICYAIAAVFLVFAVSHLIGNFMLKRRTGSGSVWDIIISIITLALAIVFIVRPVTIAQIIPIILGIIVLADGAVMVISWVVYRSFIPKGGIATLLIGLVCIVLGYLAIAHSFGTQVVFMQFIGASLIVAGGSNVFSQFMLEAADRRKKNAVTVDFTTTPNDAADSGSGSDQDDPDRK